MSAPVDSAPCRHIGSPSPAIVDSAVEAISGLAGHSALLAIHGLSPEEFELALPAAIETLRGRMSASNADRRTFLQSILDHLCATGIASSVSRPAYGEDTVYRLEVPSLGSVAIIQKGCPDGAHSSSAWSVPDWAEESYIWWLCSSTKMHPGEHIAKGVNRLKSRILADEDNSVDGIIFHNQLCGSKFRPCPKQSIAVTIDDQIVPPPCIYILPTNQSSIIDYNWGGTRSLTFPDLLMSAWHIQSDQAPMFTGYVGFKSSSNGTTKISITNRFGPGRISKYRS